MVSMHDEHFDRLLRLIDIEREAERMTSIGARHGRSAGIHEFEGTLEGRDQRAIQPVNGGRFAAGGWPVLIEDVGADAWRRVGQQELTRVSKSSRRANQVE